MCSCYGPRLLLPAAREKGRDTLEKERVVVVVGVNTSTQHLLPHEEKRCVENSEGGGG